MPILNPSDVTITTAEFYGVRRVDLHDAEHADLVALGDLVAALLVERDIAAALID